MMLEHTRQTVKIKDLGEVVTGTTPPTQQKEYFGGKYPFIKPSDISPDQRYIFKTEMTLSDEGCDYQKRKLLPKNSICVVCIGTIGKMCFTSKPSFTNQQLNSIIVDQSLYEPIYIYYLLKTYITHVKHLNAGSASGRENVNKSSFGNLEIEVHELPIQRKIAAILSGYDRLIENNTRRIEILEEMARSIYREWFVKFRFPGHEQVQMVDSELGLIPEGWEVGRLDDALILQRGFDLPTQQRKEGNIPIYASTGVTGTHNEAKVKAPGVVTGRSGSLGTVIYIDKDFWPLNTTLWVKEFRRVTPLYAFYLLSDLKLEQYNSGAAVPTLNRNDIHGRPVVIPPQKILEHLNLFVKPLLVLKKNLLKRSDNLRQTRDLLLPRLISGEIDVENLDIKTGEIAA
ncbi:MULTISPECIES: restriction endonuclease subunit S [unclassified Microcoleus]|uniref:restriction endonuclease subunit S n=1 Tax=unclassified Microcoleus TaxID=2642155 RepID=UPI002FD258BE